MPYQNSFTTLKQKLLQENSSPALQQSINWIKFIKWYWQYYSRERSNFQEKAHSIFTNIAISQRQEDQRKHSFLEKKNILHERENWFPEISHHLMDHAVQQSTHQFHKIFFHISKCLAYNAEKILKLKIAEKQWILLTYTYTNIYTYIICDKNDSK